VSDVGSMNLRKKAEPMELQKPTGHASVGMGRQCA